MANGSNANISLANIRNNNKQWVLDDTTQSAEIELVQKTLFRAGYWSSPNNPDGKYGKYSVAATRGFQFEHGLAASGAMNKDTLVELERWSGTLTTTRSKNPSLTYIRRGTQYATKGDSGAAITQIRKLLNNKGYTCSSTGAFDDALLVQVKKFQSNTIGLTSDGNVGQATLAVLESTSTNTNWVTNNTVKLTAGLLAQCGFKQVMLCDDFVAKLNAGFNNKDYGYTEKEQVKQILAQIMTETQYGTYLLEKLYQAGAENYSSLECYPYFGGGFIHLTGKDTYADFARETGHSDVVKNPLYATLKVAIEYPGLSTMWFLKKHKGYITSTIKWKEMTSKEICQKLTDAVRGYGHSSTDRYARYEQISKVLK